MTTVNVSTTENKVEIIDSVNNVLEIDTTSNNVVEVNVSGPQGPAGTAIDLSNAVDDSVLYFDSASGTLKADNTTTKLSLVFGGSF
tara:strand:+ start:359 stop:616 length:258 start_codon:yes stop_codon:yes gene_type:complete